MKRKYQIPHISVISMKVEDQLLAISNVTTTDPKDGGDPTGGKGNDSNNPFINSGNGAKAVQFDVEEDVEEDFKAW